jgi:hypothetical protein
MVAEEGLEPGGMLAAQATGEEADLAPSIPTDHGLLHHNGLRSIG